MTNWSDAVRKLGGVDARELEAQLVCRCGAANSPNLATNAIKVDEHGNAACDACGAFGVVQTFLPPTHPNAPRRRA